MNNLKNSRRKMDESGLVSIMVASVLMVIMALITLGFTRVVQNEQRQAVDNQLSKQAFYAAESGINIAASTPGFPGNLKNDCDVSSYNNGEIAAGNTDIVFTCLQINPTPDDIVFGNDSITTNKSKVVPIRTNEEPAYIAFQWNDNNSNNVQTNCNVDASLDFERDSASWNKVSPLRLDLIRIPTGSFNRSTLIANQMSVILYPCNSASGLSSFAFSSATGPDTVGRIVPVNCQNTGDYECQIQITGLTASPAQEYYARFSAVYSEVNVRITAGDTVGDRLTFSSAQAVVDSTGRAVDVFRRLQARVPLYDTYVYPNAAIQTLDDICKVYEVQSDRVIDGC